MTGPYDPPSDPQISHPLIQEAFGWSTDSEVPPSVKLGMSQAADTLAALRAATSQAVTNTWAGAAVQTDQLQGKVGYNIAGQLQAAANTVAALQQPVAMQVLGPLSQAVEQSNALGTVPPMPGAPPSTPACVAIRQAGANGDIGPAIEAYRAMAFQQRFTRGTQYTDAVRWITDCLPPGSPVREGFANVVLQLQNLPDGTPLGFNTGPAPGTQTAAASGGFLPGGNVFAGYVSESGAPPGGPFPAGARIPPVGAPQAGALNAPTGSGPAPTTVIDPVTGLPVQFNILPAYGVPGTPVETAAVPISTGSGPVTVPQLVVPPGFIPGSGPAPVPPVPFGPPGGSGAPPMIGPATGGNIPGSGPPPYQPPTGGGTSTPITCDQFGNCGFVGGPAGSGPPPGYGQPPTGPGGTPPGVAPPSVPPRPETPPTKPGVPPVKDQPCLKICKDDTPPKKCDYTAYCSAASGIIYVVRADQPPRSSSDTLLQSGDPTEFGWSTFPDKCGGATFTPPGAPAGGAPVGPFAGGCADFPPTPAAGGINVGAEFLSWIGLLDQNGGVAVPFPDAGVTDIGEQILNGITQFSGQVINQLLTALGQFLAQTGCADGAQIGLIAVDALTGFIERYIGANLSQIRLPNAYQRNFKCPVRLPDIGEATIAWLANEIDDNTLQCWVRANNGRFNDIATAIRGARTKLSPLQIATLYMRDFIGGQDFKTRIRETGMIRPTDGDDLLNLLKVIPPPGDIISMMVKDAADTVNIDWSKEDQEFPQKYAGQLKDWGKQQGIPDDYMQLLWRAHYSIPAPGQLYDMLHRLRPGEVPPGIETTQDTIRQALQQQDISPKWVERLMAISYRPLTRIDAARAYKIGALGYDDLVNAYRDLGYGSDNAKRLADFQSRSADLSFKKHWTVKAYAQGEITPTEMRQALEEDGATDQAVTLAFDRASLAARAGSRRACARSYRQRYLTGDMALSDVTAALTGQGLAADQIETLTSGWECEKAARGKAIPSGEIYALYEMGAIGIPDVVQRLIRLGYRYDDAVLIARRFAQRLSDKISKQEAAQLKAQQAADEKAAKQIARTAAQQARAIRQGEAMAEKAAATRVAREKRLIEAGEKFSKHFPGSLPDAIVAVKAMYNQFISQNLYTQDEVINALLVVTGSKEVYDIPSLATAVQAALASGPGLSSTALLDQSQQTTTPLPPPVAPQATR